MFRSLFACAAIALGLSISMAPTSAKAASITAAPPIAAAAHASDVVLVGERRVRTSVQVRFHYRGGHPYFNGYRGKRIRHEGHRLHRGYWFPVIAFNIAPRVEPRPVIRKPWPRAKVIDVSRLHVAWCQGRYRTYRIADNSYAFKAGKRTHCTSPYSR